MNAMPIKLSLSFFLKTFLILRILFLARETGDEKQFYFSIQKTCLLCISLNSACQILSSLARLSLTVSHQVQLQKQTDTFHHLAITSP